MPDVIERQEVQDKFPVQDAHENKETDECGNFENAPIRIRSAFPFDFPKDRFGIVSQIAEKDVAPDVLGFAIVPMAVNRQPINRVPFLIGLVTVPHVMSMMHVLIECLGEPERDRFQNGEHPIQRAPTEIRVVNEVVRDPVDVPGDADGVDDSHAKQDPPWSNRKERKQGQNVGKVQNPTKDRNRIQFRVGQNLHTNGTDKVV